MTQRQKIAGALVITLTILVRFVGITHSPPQLGNDEISVAWDAYSILHTLRDEHNHYLPMAFQSHGTYKAPLAIYLAVVPTWIFGNTDISARLPSMFLGVLTVLVLGLLVYELTDNASISILTSFILAISPWHIIVSRAALETNVALFFVVSGVYLFYFGLKRHQIVATLLSTVCFALSIYSYHTEWGFVPLLLLALAIINIKVCIKKPIYYISAGLLVILILPIFINSLTANGSNARQNTELITREARLANKLKDPSLYSWQKGQLIITSIIGNYSSYIAPQHMFFDGFRLLAADDPYSTGLFLPPFLIGLIVGLLSLKKIYKKNSTIILVWAFLGPIIPALTLGGPNNYRNLVSIAPYTIIIAGGFFMIWNYLQNKTLIKIIIFGSIVISFFYFCAAYFYHMPYESGENFQYGYKQIALYIKDNYSQYSKIVVDPRFGDVNIYDGVPHLYIPYFTYMDPRRMLSRIENPNGLFFDKYEFRAINWNLEQIDPGNLYVVPASNPPPVESSLRTLKEIKLPNGKVVFKLFTAMDLENH